MKKIGEPLDISHLKGSVSPQRDLWPEIVQRIQANGTSRSQWRKPNPFSNPLALLVSAAAALIIGIAVGSANYFQQSRIPEYIRLVNAEYKDVEHQVLYNLDNSGLQNSVTVQVKENLEVIDASVNRILYLLQQNPGNSSLTERLYEINVRRFEFLETIRALIQEDRKSGGERVI